MSNFFKTTKHPVTGKFEEAIWLDGFFGGRRYGVQFPNGDIFNAESYKFETKESRSKKKKKSRAVDKNTEEDRRLHFLPDIKNGA